MPPVRNSNQGRVHLQGYSHFSNYVRHWIESVNKNARRRIMFPWQIRNKNPTNKTGHNGSSQQAEEDEEDEEEDEEELDPIITPSNGSSQQAEEDEEEEEELDPILTPSDGFQQHEAWHANPMLIEDAPYRSSGPVGQALEPYYLGQANTQHGEQTWEDNQFHIPTFPGANMPAQMTNTAPPEGIYSPGRSSTFAPQNIYDAAAYPPTFSPSYQNIYATSDYLSHLAPPSIYSSPWDYTIPTATASGSSSIPVCTDSTAMIPWSNPMQPDYTYRQSLEEASQGDFGLYWPELPAHREPNAPTTASQCAQTIATAPSAPVLPAENANIAISSSEEDPFMGADWSPETSEDWL